MDPAVLQDQRHAYDEMRERCPVAYSPFLDWSLFRHQDVVDAVEDTRTFSSRSNHLAIPNGMDPPEHTVYRSALDPFFTDEQMATFEQRCRPVAIELVRDMIARQESDAVTEFAEPFALKSLCLFLGWPIGGWERLLGWTHGNQQAAFLRDRELGRALARMFTAYVTEELQHYRNQGDGAPDSVTTRLMRLTVDGKLLTDVEIVSIVRNWTAGVGTVAAGIGILLLHLATRQDLQQRLRAEPSVLPQAVDEILRVDGPLVANRRTTTREVEIDGRQIGQGQRISLMWIPADRDPRAFDDPDDVRLDRNEQGNVLFGDGIHYCQGAPLARLQMRIALEELLRQSRHIELSGAEPPSRVTFPSNGMLTLSLRIS